MSLAHFICTVQGLKTVCGDDGFKHAIVFPQPWVGMNSVMFYCEAIGERADDAPNGDCMACAGKLMRAAETCVEGPTGIDDLLIET